MPQLLIILLLVVCFGLAAWLEPRQACLASARASADSLMEVLLGDSRRLFAAHFFFKADVYLHSGYYPTIFDAGPVDERPHLATEAEGDHHEEHAASPTPAPSGAAQYGFLGPPRDWVDRFSRHFFPSQHMHLEGALDEREVLPWLRWSASLDPTRVETYTVAAYWLRHRVKRREAALQFLREGWHYNPDSHEILLELGKVFDEDYHDGTRARHVLELALRKWQAQEPAKPEPNQFALEQILVYLARLAEREGRLPEALRYSEMLKRVSPHPDIIQQQIDALKRRLGQ